jgi:DNA ligase 1
MKNHKKLYKLDHRGQMRYWEIHSDGTSIEIEYGIIGMDPIYSSEDVSFGLAGRTPEEQIKLRIDSRASRKIAAGYKETEAEALGTHGQNELGLLKPMLASKFENAKHLRYDLTYVQPKLDGHRCLITNDCGEIKAYSRNGKIIDSIDHILDGIVGLRDGETIDGELYHHGSSLQTISSWVKRKQENTKLIKFICYDVILDCDYADRFPIIKSIEALSNSIEVIDTDFVYGYFDTKPLFRAAVDKGYEGLILRPSGFCYEVGKRSKGLIKVKGWVDEELPILSVAGSKDGHAIFTLEKNGKKFTVLSHGNHAEKRMNLEKKNDLVGRMVQIKYANLTKDGVPFHPIAVMWRDPNEE